ncbi:methionine adenosyltransferase domain-containing protein [Streptococcus agalactiae]|uniref:methionine adenosyltransferase domain-containing protein n=1 Tax=Streptococcus agalactiae TaxID=1311 RepID=UPI00021A1663|nr:methionine adenosyltransferase domain-containing protein [Streptococcus agalactiae]EGS27181.1 S-adenosylmethionine synthetase [Streptococcus agalactiae FSL S3-026]EPV88323.1 S-adenosylmethionine synthetase [Streptococcus agalactiae FSL S3-586]
MIFTSEQVSSGHPDKLCDQISDTIVTECLKHDKNSRVAVETLIKDNQVVVAGEVSTKYYFNLEGIVKKVLEPYGMRDVMVTNLLGVQSPDIAQGVDKGSAGDQGIMFGYATDETPEFLPLPYVLATRVLEKLTNLGHPALGKDPSKVDRSAAYMARKIAKDFVREGYAKRCEVQLAYAIGVAEPVGVYVNTFGTSDYPLEQLVGVVRERYDLTPQGIIKELNLLDVDYTKTTCLGHFTKPYLPWEQ